LEDPPTALTQTTFSKSQRTGKELAVLSWNPAVLWGIWSTQNRQFFKIWKNHPTLVPTFTIEF
jgi:hypothetical protein